MSAPASAEAFPIVHAAFWQPEERVISRMITAYFASIFCARGGGPRGTVHTILHFGITLAVSISYVCFCFVHDHLVTLCTT
ncbi:uncharacterized protein K460DRAFT_172284 [Cucurbitaria berberidis CBS 394.84]|uniref:Uncharacterized protein n=1 Tax=Cucurbitaria berberidis CBS 394.84 TaxID=1168544 RepID=A0A9P4L481_9PLEO|nr:uncharacterized protein K460DRAFT_172284 [Cucurbitaria berberidis CBS 394.84]KAF1841731.1 hypothetical protein K460DRAFT_172284 [Cucurbitaria berberidis CBS 394.84]